ncbi:uncharacterized protein LOC128552400 [Mercenaria mercenaria]|uniref:uncharacterized protein LOC128552400 n=1 Tax=Mercenaria mercenaria TaxID=6596 RepID=UPI00234E9F01|nr:uncharacterized protein LOC128552400 [Mercenaria mercenaria]
MKGVHAPLPLQNIQTAKDDLLKTFEDLESSTVGSVLAENNFSVQEDCNVLKRIEGRSDSDMKQSIENLERENKDLKQKIIKLEQKSSKPSPKVRIQIFAQGGEIPTKISKELESMLGARMNTKSSHLQICTVNSYDKILFDLPLLVICITSSRLGTDAIKAINDIPEQAKGKTTLIMFHHKNENSLPKQLSKYVLTTDEFRELGAVCDMAFWKNEGIYPCDFNYKALDKIIAFIENA